MIRNFTIKKKKKYFAVFLIIQEGSFSIVRKKRFNPSKQTVKVSTGTYVLDVSKPTYIKGLKLFYFIDFAKVDGQLPLKKEKKDNKIKDKGLKLQNKKSEIKITPRMLDDLISQHIIRDLSQNLSDNRLVFNILTFVLGCALGGSVGFIVAGYV